MGSLRYILYRFYLGLEICVCSKTPTLVFQIPVDVLRIFRYQSLLFESWNLISRMSFNMIWIPIKVCRIPNDILLISIEIFQIQVMIRKMTVDMSRNVRKVNITVRIHWIPASYILNSFRNETNSFQIAVGFLQFLINILRLTALILWNPADLKTRVGILQIPIMILYSIREWLEFSAGVLWIFN